MNYDEQVIPVFQKEKWLSVKTGNGKRWRRFSGGVWMWRLRQIKNKWLLTGL